MVDADVIDRIRRLLDADDGATVDTSMRLPAALREAAALAVSELGVAPSTTVLTGSALRAALETALMDAALRVHFEQHPHARPSLAETALALALQDGSPLAEHPEVIERAAAEVFIRRPGATPYDVILWAEARQAAAS